MSTKAPFIAFLLLFAALVIFSCKGIPDQFPAPDFKVEDIFTGDEIHIADLKGRPVVLYFFASW